MRPQPQEARAYLQRGSQFKWPQQRSRASQIEWPPVYEPSWPPAGQHYAGDAPSSSPVPAPLYSQEGAWQQPFPTPLKPPARKAPKSKLPRPRRRKWRRLLLIAISVMLLIGILLGTQLNGPLGAQIADGMRAVLGPTLTAQVESWFLGISDQAHQVQYQLSGQHVQPPWTTSHTRITNSGPQKIMPLVPLKPFITPALPGEGVWVTDGLPAPTSGLPTLVAKTFIRPDPARPYAVVTLLQFDMRFLALHMIAGTREPGGAARSLRTRPDSSRRYAGEPAARRL